MKLEEVEILRKLAKVLSMGANAIEKYEQAFRDGFQQGYEQGIVFGVVPYVPQKKTKKAVKR